jgi:hypothetical protein
VLVRPLSDPGSGQWRGVGHAADGLPIDFDRRVMLVSREVISNVLEVISQSISGARIRHIMRMATGHDRNHLTDRTPESTRCRRR